MGILYIVATPIGNLDDVTLRAIKTLSSVDLILCEDTRHTGLLLQKLNIQAKMMPYYDEIEDKKIPEVIEMLEEGKNLAIVSDAGTPLISDPGFRLVRECIKRGIKVESVPGASALLTALTSSGLPPDKFMFLGYPPEKQSQRIKLFQSLLQCFKTLIQTPTVVFYCAPHKLESTLTDLQSTFGDMEITVTRELTKIHEEVWKGMLSKAASKFVNPKGEFVLLFQL